ncbi:uncharacterized protein VTP21DRAFT_6437 [Calcarisporiella thermophila]|uniref:uncharacterized protein n=1 Tax=Calcarisporiella thermophila TaxID=911321 RepID=UPI003743F610
MHSCIIRAFHRSQLIWPSSLLHPRPKAALLVRDRFHGLRCYNTTKKEETTPLTKYLSNSIKIAGAMSLSQFMKEVLINPLSGYYTKGDVFGEKGDFITSPEISQMFGELIGIWFVTQWHSLGKPNRTRIVELGPGRGTLIDDMLRALSRFPDIYQTIQGLHLVEASTGLRKLQKNLLCGEATQATTDEHGRIKEAVREDGIKVHWHNVFYEMPQEWSMVVAHELFDALPIYKFEKIEQDWRELMVDIDDDPNSPHHFRLVRAPASNKNSAFVSGPRFEKFKAGDRVEVSPDSWVLMRDICEHLRTSGGSALIIDYGEDFIQGDTFRAIRKHKIVHPMSLPGETDLSADVDFSALREAAGEIVSTHGPVTQAHFLHSLGIQARLQMLLKHARPGRAEALVSSYRRLVDPLAMGKTYKVMAVTPKDAPAPIAFDREQRADK